MIIEEYKVKCYIENTVNYINFCRRKSIEILDSEGFAGNEYNFCVERYLATAITFEEFLEILGMKLIRDKDGFYSVK